MEGLIIFGSLHEVMNVVHVECLEQDMKLYKEGPGSCLEQGKMMERRCLNEAQHTKRSENAADQVLV